MAAALVTMWTRRLGVRFAAVWCFCSHATQGRRRARRKVRRCRREPWEGYCVTQDLREEATSLQPNPEAVQTWGSDTQGDTFHRAGQPSTDKVILKLSPPICVSSALADTHIVRQNSRDSSLGGVCVCVCYLSASVPMVSETAWHAACRRPADSFTPAWSGC